MAKDQEQKKKKKKLPLDYMPNISNVVSATECTGLMPTLPMDKEEYASELDLFSTSRPPVWDEDDLSD